MKRLTDKELHDAIEERLGNMSFSMEQTSHFLAYAQLRALERLADNVHVLNETLSVIRADHVKPVEGPIIDDGVRA